MKAFDIFGGAIRVIESPILPSRIPNFKLAPGDYIGDEFRARMQAWCDEFFGTHEVALFFDGSVMGIPGGPTIALRPEHMALLRTKSPLSASGLR